jgi:hypothetical protein
MGGASSKAEAENYILGDKTFRILPEERLRVTIEKGESSTRHKGEICYVQLLPENQRLIRSNEFAP